MSKWEKQVKVSLDDIFDNGDDKKEEDSYSKMSNEEINEVYEKVTVEEDIDTDLQDIDDFFNDSEQLELASKGIQLTTAKEYKIETSKKPIWNGKITNLFKNWLKDEHPELAEFIKNEEATIKLEITKKKTSSTDKNIEKKLNKTISDLHMYRQELRWLYKFMDNLNFGDFEPTDKAVKRIERIDELVKNG